MGLFDLFKSKKPAESQAESEALEKGLEKTKDNMFSRLSKMVAGKSSVNEAVLDDLEELLVTSDVGVATTLKIISRIEERVDRDRYMTTTEFHNSLREEVTALLAESDGPVCGEDAGERPGTTVNI